MQRHVECLPWQRVVDARDTSPFRHPPAQATIWYADGHSRARTGCARGVDCSIAAAWRALLLFPCYFGKKAGRRVASLTPRVESLEKFPVCAVQRNVPPVIRLFNRGNTPRRIRAFPGKPWIFRKTWPVCGAAEYSRERLCRAICRGYGRAFNRAEYRDDNLDSRADNRPDNRLDNRTRTPCSAGSSL